MGIFSPVNIYISLDNFSCSLNLSPDFNDQNWYRSTTNENFAIYGKATEIHVHVHVYAHVHVNVHVVHVHVHVK